MGMLHARQTTTLLEQLVQQIINFDIPTPITSITDYTLKVL